MSFSLYLFNPQNKNKNKINYYLRKVEDTIKLISRYSLLLLLFPYFCIKSFLRENYIVQNFIDQNASFYIFFSILKVKKIYFNFQIRDFDKILKRFNFFFTLKYFCYNPFKKGNSIAFNKSVSGINLISDYFFYFDKNLKNDNNLAAPFYLPRQSYNNNLNKKLTLLRNSKKKFKIIFSGSSHKDWYEQNIFYNDITKLNKILSREKIIQCVIKNFKKNTLVINKKSDLNKIHNSSKEILLILTNPKKLKREKIISKKQHLNLISQSNFFLCMPGTSMPICHHLVESMIVGTVPILSYNKFIYPRLNYNNALFFLNKKELIKAIHDALSCDLKRYHNMKLNIEKYYDENWSPERFGKKIINSKFPVKIYTNFDHISSNERMRRLGRKSLFK